MHVRGNDITHYSVVTLYVSYLLIVHYSVMSSFVLLSLIVLIYDGTVYCYGEVFKIFHVQSTGYDSNWSKHVVMEAINRSNFSISHFEDYTVRQMYFISSSSFSLCLLL